MPLTRCTFTGVDETTSLVQLEAISAQSSLVEWGMLYSPRQQGSGRYPSVEFLKRAILSLPSRIPVALHVCGRGVPDLVEGESVVTELVDLIGQRQGRVQLNFNVLHGKVTAERVAGCMQRLGALTFIVQHNAANADAWAILRNMPNCFALFDDSGGRGLRPDAWPIPVSGQYCGYAGGLSPTNLPEQLMAINSIAAGNDYWIDLEGNLRDADDQFSLDASKACLDAVEQFLAQATDPY